MIAKQPDSKIILRRDRTFARVVNYKAAGTGVNVDGKPLVFSLRKPGSSEPFFSLTVGDATTASGSIFTVTDAASGAHHLLITDEETKLFPILTGGKWSVSRIEGGAKIWMLEGELEIANP